MAHYILDKAYKTTDEGGVEAFLVVVQGGNAGECRLSATKDAGSILGVTIHRQRFQNQNVSVRKAGIARVIAAGGIPVGSPVFVDTPTGRVMAEATSDTGFAECLGFAETAANKEGDEIEIFISLHERAVPTE